VKSSCVKPFPGEAFTPQHRKRGKAAAYSPWYPRVLPDLLLPRRVSVDGCHNESQRTWLLAKKMVDMIDMFIYKWTELTCQLDCLLVRKHEYHNFAQFDSSAH
jgi:hypothetical protein